MQPKTIALVSSALQRLLARLMRRGRRQPGPDRQYKRHRAELQQMSARELNDLGIGSGEIPALLKTPATWHMDRC
ncbi:MAG: DUF1127 domain-containing protein [Polaromonas sp.]